ncbi:hypothetical protein [Hymenobacter sp. IS2118]|uniref:hypothetical protein n=1 Tax=Hymenobacter sp. IS2118 TaxID=1505605 RepID=UPI00090718DB|nr:hypothetical protein [Hymenobacter sp. IS2118]
MENFAEIVSQLESAKVNIAEVARKLKLQIFELEVNSARYDFIARDHPNKFVKDKNIALRDRILVCYHRMMAHELRLVKESDALRFENICRNAQMQMEGLFTYFYNFHYNDNVKQFVEAYNLYISEINASHGQNFREIQRDYWWKVTFADKYTLFQKFTEDADLTNFLKVLAKYRNSISHVGYVEKTKGNNKDADSILFEKNANVIAVLYALEKLSEYVEFNTLKVNTNVKAEAPAQVEASAQAQAEAQAEAEAQPPAQAQAEAPAQAEAQLPVPAETPAKEQIEAQSPAPAEVPAQAQEKSINSPSEISVETKNKAQPTLSSPNTREFEGILNVPDKIERWGFADNVYIPAMLVKNNGWETGQLIQGTAKLSFNAKKNCDTWKALNASAVPKADNAQELPNS